VSQVRRYLEPGPIVLVTSAYAGARNIMTMGWQTVMEFTPSLVRLRDLQRQPQLRDDPPEPRVRDQSSDDQADGHRRPGSAPYRGDRQVSNAFGLTAETASRVGAPLIAECHANFECRSTTTPCRESTTSSSSRSVKAHVAASPKHPANPALHRGRRVHGLGQSHQPTVAIPA